MFKKCCITLLYFLSPIAFCENSETQQKAFVNAVRILDAKTIKSLCDNGYDVDEIIDPRFTPFDIDISTIIWIKVKQDEDGNIVEATDEDKFDEKETDKRMAEVITVLAKHG